MRKPRKAPDARVSVNLTSEQFAKIKQAAESADRSMASYLRVAALTAASRWRPPGPENDPAGPANDPARKRRQS